ncbi:hypothetical protein GEMRC1_000528 [Eukaryota sp. GEM-RC1]
MVIGDAKTSSFLSVLSSTASFSSTSVLSLELVYGSLVLCIDSYLDLMNFDVVGEIDVQGEFTKNSTLIKCSNSELIMNDLNVSNLNGQLYEISHDSTVVVSTSSFSSLNSGLTLIDIQNSRFNSTDMVIGDAKTSSFLSILSSTASFNSTLLQLIELSQGSLIFSTDSYLDLIDLDIVGEINNDLGSVFICHDFDSLVLSITSTIYIQSSNLFGCLIGDIFHFEITLSDSLVYFDNFAYSARITQLNLQNSVLFLNTNYLVVFRSIASDSESSIKGNDEYLNLQLIADRFSEFEECVSTHSWNLQFSFLYAHLIPIVVSITNFNSLTSTISTGSNSTVLRFEDVYAFSPDVDFFKIDFETLSVQYYYQTQLTLCPVILDSPRPPTLGGEVVVSGINLGRELLFFFSELVEVTSPYLPFNHSLITFYIGEGYGCHELEVKRSLDSMTSFFTFCYAGPVIHSSSPTSYSFTKYITFYGENLYPDASGLAVKFLNLTAECEIISVSHSQIVLEIINVCDISRPHFHILFELGSTDSNLFPMNLVFPPFSHDPVTLTPESFELMIEVELDLDLSRMATCNDIGIRDITAPTPSTVGFPSPTSMNVTFDVTGQDLFGFYFEISSHFFKLVEITVIGFFAQPLEFPCITNHLCLISICSTIANLDITNFIPQSGPLVTIDGYYYDLESACVDVEFFTHDFGQLEDLMICSVVTCNNITHLPIIASFDAVTPSKVLWNFNEVSETVFLFGNNFNSSEIDLWTMSLLVDGNSITINEVNFDSISFELTFSSIGVSVISFINQRNSAIPLFSIECGVFITISPVFFVNGKLSIISYYDYSSIFLNHDSEIITVDAGINPYSISTDFPYISFLSEVLSSSIDLDHLPYFIRVDVLHSFEIEFHDSNLNVSVWSTGQCFVHHSFQMAWFY